MSVAAVPCLWEAHDASGDGRCSGGSFGSELAC